MSETWTDEIKSGPDLIVYKLWLNKVTLKPEFLVQSEQMLHA